MTAAADSCTSKLALQVYTSASRLIGGERTFSPVTSSLLLGREDAVLVDAQFMEEEVDALGDMVEASGRRLTHIVITHGHADHYFGAERLAQRFAGAAVVAAAGVVDYISTHMAAETRTFGMMFSDGLVLPNRSPSCLDGEVIWLEEEPLHVIEVGQGDIAPSTIIHAPSSGIVVAGDVAYNGIHQMLGLSGPAEWSRWIESVESIERLDPNIVVAGHKLPGARDDEPKRILHATRAYIESFAKAAKTASSAPEIVRLMTELYPHHGNPTTLWFSAAAAIKARDGKTASPA